ncbi:MAG: hypothetical protein U0792_16235 [Gemmataceae bacterium]
MVGGFYTRLDSVKVRGKDKKLWFDAVGALRESNRLKPGQTIVLMNLGLAYLLSPDGKDVGEATRFFSEATTAAKTDKNLDPVAHASLLINLGVATLSDGGIDKQMTLLDDGEKITRTPAGLAAKRLVPISDAALLYTRPGPGWKKDTEDEKKAINMLGQYLRVTSLPSLCGIRGTTKHGRTRRWAANLLTGAAFKIGLNLPAWSPV